MSCLFWNCRDLGVPLTVLTLGDLLRSKNPDLVFLAETRSLRWKIEELKRKWNLNGIGVDRVGNSGGLAMLWKKGVKVDLQSYSSNHIDVRVQTPNNSQPWRCTGIYGVADQSLRHQSWDSLRSLASGGDLPWVVGGDYNEILSNDEKEGGSLRASSLIEGFRAALVDCALTEVGFG